MLLPAQFWVPHGNPPWRGGVERACMSTTADKSVALSYANGRGTIVEISVGRIQIGGDVSFLSMVRPPPAPKKAKRGREIMGRMGRGGGKRNGEEEMEKPRPATPCLLHRAPELPSWKSSPQINPRGWGRALGRLCPGAVSGGEGDHVPALHVPRGRRRPPRGAHR